MHPHGAGVAHVLEDAFHGIEPVLELVVPVPHGADQTAHPRCPPDIPGSQVADNAVDMVRRGACFPLGNRHLLGIQDPAFPYVD